MDLKKSTRNAKDCSQKINEACYIYEHLNGFITITEFSKYPHNQSLPILMETGKIVYQYHGQPKNEGKSLSILYFVGYRKSNTSNFKDMSERMKMAFHG